MDEDGEYVGFPPHLSDDLSPHPGAANAVPR